MRLSDTRRKQHVNFKIEYLSEDIIPESRELQPILADEGFAKVKRWHVDRVFYFLAGISVICLSVVAVVPNPVVQASAGAIWAGSAGLARYLLKGAYRTTGKHSR